MADLTCKIIKSSSESFFIVDDSCPLKLTESPIIIRCDSVDKNIRNIYDLAAKYDHNKILAGKIPEDRSSHLICFKENDALRILSGSEFRIKCPNCNEIYTLNFENYCNAYRENNDFRLVR